MYAVVCGKRTSSIFADELVPPSPPSPHSSHHHHPAKRSRCSPHCAFDVHRREALLHQLLSFFPDMDPQLLERALEASGDDLDSAIKSLNELRLESAEAILSATGCKSENGLPTAVQPSVEGTGRDLFRFIMHLLHQARKKTEISKLTTDEHKEVASNALCMWTKEDVDRAETRMLKVFRAVQTGPWVS